jgi:hypothetical protein
VALAMFRRIIVFKWQRNTVNLITIIFYGLGVRQFVGAGAGADTAPSMTRCVQHDRFDKKNDMKQL